MMNKSLSKQYIYNYVRIRNSLENKAYIIFLTDYSKSLTKLHQSSFIHAETQYFWEHHLVLSLFLGLFYIVNNFKLYTCLRK